LRRPTLVIAPVIAAAAVLAGAVLASGGNGAAVATVAVHHARTARTLDTSSPRLHCKLQRRRFHTLPGARPAEFCMAIRARGTPSGDPILVTPRPDLSKTPHEQYGLMLISGTGKLLWYQRRPAKVHDLKTVTYQGKPMLAYFERDKGSAHYSLLDQQYREVARVKTAGVEPTDEHDLRVTPQGTAFVASDHLRALRAGPTNDYVVQEIDVATGKPVFQWRALQRVPVSDSYEDRSGRKPYDFFHGNAIDPPTADDPTVMVSSRNTSAIYGIDHKTGRTSWILGGKRDQFSLHRHRDWVFCTQHDTYRLPGGKLFVFDNGGAHTFGRTKCRVHPARAMLFDFDPAKRKVSLVRSVSSKPFTADGKGIFSEYVGSVQVETGGNWLIDWGSPTRISDVGADGREQRLLRLPYWSYRAMPAAGWTGRPPGRPAIAAQRRNGHVTVWASWNGATEIASWQLLAGDTASTLKPVGGPVAFQDLETRMALRTGAKLVAVRALDASGATLGESTGMGAAGFEPATSRV
jgi:hypothetical protein